MDKSVERLHRALVNAIRSERGDTFDRPVTVSEIYQTFVPYRTARTAVGFEMNADYEYALLRLLAGEGDLARLEPVEVQESLRAELESPNPNVSLFREFANCDVWVTPASGSNFDDERDLNDELLEDEADELAFEPEDRSEPREQPSATPPSERGPSVRRNTCAFCGADLPSSRSAKFCPHCGNDLTQRPCAKCGEILDPKWRFCVNCGAPVRMKE